MKKFGGMILWIMSGTFNLAFLVKGKMEAQPLPTSTTCLPLRLIVRCCIIDVNIIKFPLEDQFCSSCYKSTSLFYLSQFGKQELSQLAEFLTGHMHTIVYPLLAHRQLSIRENATKAFSAFLSRCEVKVSLA